jgi:adenosyl cobinamide kinase/adenosyl cobinamide phosphate guanylyltransferase
VRDREKQEGNRTVSGQSGWNTPLLLCEVPPNIYEKARVASVARPVVRCAHAQLMSSNPFSRASLSSVDESSSSSSFPWARLVTGCLGLGLLTLLFGYYLPLRKQDQALVLQQQELRSVVESDRAQLERTTAELVSIKQENESLTEKQRKVDAARAAGDQKSSELVAAVKTALAPKVKQALLVVNETPEGVVVLIDNSRLYRDHQEVLYQQGQQLLCEVAKALHGQPLTWTVSNEAADSVVKNSVLRRLLPTTFQVTSARAAQAVLGLEACGVPGKDLLALGGAHYRPRKGISAKSTGETRILLQLKP